MDGLDPASADPFFAHVAPASPPHRRSARGRSGCSASAGTSTADAPTTRWGSARANPLYPGQVAGGPSPARAAPRRCCTRSWASSCCRRADRPGPRRWSRASARSTSRRRTPVRRSRVAEQGVLRSERFGRSMRWHLTASGRHILETGAERIYHFGEPYDWEGRVAGRALPGPRDQATVATSGEERLAFEGFGELAPSLAVSPHVDRESSAREILADLDLAAESLLLRARTGSIAADRDLVTPAWTLDTWRRATPSSSRGCGARTLDRQEPVRATIELVHRWRGFPFVDPSYPRSAPSRPGWARRLARASASSATWSEGAQRWFAGSEGDAR